MIVAIILKSSRNKIMLMKMFFIQTFKNYTLKILIWITLENDELENVSFITTIIPTIFPLLQLLFWSPYMNLRN